MPEIATLTNCPPWCAHDEILGVEEDLPYVLHRSPDVQWGGSGIVRLEAVDDEPADLTAVCGQGTFDVTANGTAIRELAECLTALADRMDDAK
jgi:hypothetical protein